MTFTRVLNMTGAALLLTGLLLFTTCAITGVWDGRWLLAAILIAGFCFTTAWADTR